MSPSVDPLSHALGGIEKQLELITKTLSEDRLASATYRTQMRNDLTVVRDAVHDLKNKVDNHAEQLAEMKPDVSDYVQRRAEAIGMSKLAHLGAALGGGSFALAVQWLLRKFGS